MFNLVFKFKSDLLWDHYVTITKLHRVKSNTDNREKAVTVLDSDHNPCRQIHTNIKQQNSFGMCSIIGVMEEHEVTTENGKTAAVFVKN